MREVGRPRAFKSVEEVEEKIRAKFSEAFEKSLGEEEEAEDPEE